MWNTSRVRWDIAQSRFRCPWCVSCARFVRRRNALRVTLPDADAVYVAAYEVFAEATRLSDAQLFALLVSIVDSNTVDVFTDMGEEYGLGWAVPVAVWNHHTSRSRYAVA